MQLRFWFGWFQLQWSNAITQVFPKAKEAPFENLNMVRKLKTSLYSPYWVSKDTVNWKFHICLKGFSSSERIVVVAVVLLHTFMVCCSDFDPEMLCEGLAQTDSFLLHHQINQLTIIIDHDVKHKRQPDCWGEMTEGKETRGCPAESLGFNNPLPVCWATEVELLAWPADRLNELSKTIKEFNQNWGFLPCIWSWENRASIFTASQLELVGAL